MTALEPQPSQWAGWMVRPLEQLGIAASDKYDENLDRYEDMLEILQDAIEERFEHKRW